MTTSGKGEMNESLKVLRRLKKPFLVSHAYVPFCYQMSLQIMDSNIINTNKPQNCMFPLGREGKQNRKLI